MRRGLPPAVVVVLGCAVSLVAAPTAAEAAYPAGGRDLVTDGNSRFSVLTPARDGVGLYATSSGAQIGSTVPLPPNAQGRPYSWTTVGLVDGRVYLAATDPDAPRTDGLQDRIGVADPSRGTFRVLCSRAPQDTQCPFATVRQIGARWVFAAAPTDHGSRAVIYSIIDRADGALFRKASARQERTFQSRVSAGNRRIADQTLNLDGNDVELDRRWGYRRSIATGALGSASSRAYLGKTKDRQFGRIDIGAASRSTSYIRFGRRGMCATTGKRVVLWDARTRRVWTRSIPAPVDTFTPTIGCTRTRVILASSAPGAAFGPAWSWPSSTEPAGWTKGPTLRPGKRLTYR